MLLSPQPDSLVAVDSSILVFERWEQLPPETAGESPGIYTPLVGERRFTG